MPNLAPPREAVSALSQDFLVDVPYSLVVDVPGAHIRLHPSSTPEQVEVDVSVSGRDAHEATDVLKRLDVGAHKTKNTVSVTSDGERSGADWWRWVRTLDADLHVDLRVPPGVEAAIRAPGGSVTLSDLRGHFDIKAMGGSCHVENANGLLDLRAEKSDVSIRNFSGKQVITRVAAGSLNLENVEANTVTTRAVSAPLTLASVTGPTRVTAKSAPVTLQSIAGPCLAEVDGGPLTYNGEPTDETDLKVVGTTLDVHLPPTHGADLRMTGPTLALADAFSFEGERTDTEIAGTLNGGGPLLTLTAVGGSIDCRPS